MKACCRYSDENLDPNWTFGMILETMIFKLLILRLELSAQSFEPD